MTDDGHPVPADDTAIDLAAEEMLPAERRQHLIDWFRDNNAGSSQDIARIFGISASTVRRDLDLLASDGIVRRTHGGAVLIRSRSTFEPSTEMSRRTAVEEKRVIVAEALRLIEPEQSILIDTGSVVCHLLADAIATLEMPLTVISNDLHVAKALTYRPNIHLFVPGGACRDGSFSLLGEPGISFLRDIRCDLLFMSAAAVDEVCLSETHLELVHLKRAMIAAAAKVVLMADSSRFMSRALHRSATIDEIDMIITDEGLSAEDIARFPAPGPEFRLARL
ncbi:DeoR/GlpR family DNA-binding transcription regulator [Frigidibacter sp. MR17.24]|uniref:DeoR/GlpR family DNA-binding transcription regulator n=1 Tax=Frigidibacter sp. MR17.24 TaxID=3127345 RepID=UPI003012A402